MPAESLYLIAADGILLIHVLFVAFVVLGLLLIISGRFFAWHWVHNFRFRIIHLAAIGVVVVQAWLGVICPLTSWEMNLRGGAGEAIYEGSFIAHWLHTLLYFNAANWVFVLIYTLFGGLVIASWFWVPPKR